jgi:hypothetical protein
MRKPSLDLDEMEDPKPKQQTQQVVKDDKKSNDLFQNFEFEKHQSTTQSTTTTTTTTSDPFKFDWSFDMNTVQSTGSTQQPTQQTTQQQTQQTQPTQQQIQQQQTQQQSKLDVMNLYKQSNQSQSDPWANLNQLQGGGNQAGFNNFQQQ